MPLSFHLASLLFMSFISYFILEDILLLAIWNATLCSSGHGVMDESIRSGEYSLFDLGACGVELKSLIDYRCHARGTCEYDSES